MDKINIFKEEYKYIKDKKIVKDVQFLVSQLPDYFFVIPASTTMKYHPKYAITEQGLVKHTKVAVNIAHTLLDNETFGNKFSELEKDLIIMALILHDGLKCGKDKSEFTLPTHPLLMSEFIMNFKEKLTLKIDDIRLLCTMIESHMGPWNTDRFTKKEILPKPTTELQKFVHMCDYLASKKFLNVEFDGLKIIE